MVREFLVLFLGFSDEVFELRLSGDSVVDVVEQATKLIEIGFYKSIRKISEIK